MKKLNVLVIGGGGREHAICVALKKSSRLAKLYCLPGNAGIAELADCENIPATDFAAIWEFVKRKGDVDLVFVAPDNPLFLGLVDYLEERGVTAFGPNSAAAIIEGSKAFSKRLMKKYGIPTADYEEFSELGAALNYIKGKKCPIVIKADGLALGKGVIIAESQDEAEVALRGMMTGGAFGDAGRRVVIEEFMTGREVSVLVFTDGKTVKPMVAAEDHKRVFDGDKGLNTGGMGAFAPSEMYTHAVAEETMKNIILPTVEAMNAEGRPFKGVLYFGLMLTADGVRVVEYNARFGDPETQAVLPLLKTDLLEIVLAICDGRLDGMDIEWSDKSAVCVMLASGGYPGEYKKGLALTIGALNDGVTLYHSGTAHGKDGGLVTSGGRVLGVTAVADSVGAARAIVYRNIEKISFDGMHYRSDIGAKNGT